MNTLRSVLVRADSDGDGLSAEAHQKHRRMKEVQKELARTRLSFAAITEAFHELRTPLHTMGGLIKLMLDGRVTDRETQQEFLVIIDEQSRCLSSLVMDILDIAAIESGQAILAGQQVSMKEVIDEAVGKLQKLAEEKGVAIEANLPLDLPHIEGDFGKLVQAVTNLLDDTIKYSAGQGKLLITAKFDNDVVLVQVIGQGIGTLANTVTPDSSAPWTSDGAGFGLYLAKRIVEAHGGQVWMESKQGNGSILSFTIPVKLDSTKQAEYREDAMYRNAQGYGLAVEETEQAVPAPECNFSKLQKTNSKRRPMNMKDKTLLLRLDELEWNSFMSVSFQLGVTPSLLARALLKQAISRYSRDMNLDDLFLLLTSPAPVTTPLSRREMEILALMTQGISNKEIADVLKVTEKAIKNHITSILRKLEANNRTHAVVLALRHNLIEPGILGTRQVPGTGSSASRKAQEGDAGEQSLGVY